MRGLDASDSSPGQAGGVWALAGDRLIIAEPEGPATILVPTERVRLLAVDLPLATRAKRLEALPFAIEDLVAEPLDSLHLALGAELSPKRYLVAVVRHEVMAEWAALADSSGLGHAPMVPDAMTLPAPAAGEWAVELAAGRAVVRAGDGTGFALPEAMLGAAWVAAGQPQATAWGEALPVSMQTGQAPLDPGPLADRLAVPPIDLRQGLYARRRSLAPSSFGRRLAWIAGIGIAAHILIAAADTVMLRVIAERRENDTRTLVAMMAPGTNLDGDLAEAVAERLPQGGAGGAPGAFLPLVTRISSALAPVAGAVQVRAMTFAGDALTLDLDGTEPGLAARVRAALAAGSVKANVTESPDSTIRVTASL